MICEPCFDKAFNSIDSLKRENERLAERAKALEGRLKVAQKYLDGGHADKAAIVIEQALAATEGKEI